METYNLAEVTKALYDAPFSLFATKTLRDLWGPAIAPASFFSLIKRLEARKVLHRLERDKYMLSGRVTHDFIVANFLYAPSYISAQTALNYYGILPQFPYEITSITTRKSITKTIQGKVFRYIQIKNTLFWGYDMQEGALIANPEKALLDLLYLKTKGLATVHLDEYDLKRMNKARFRVYSKLFPQAKGGVFI